jgi:NADPH:quinone reductase-like Zn-dependent oxidoreductase
MAAAAALPDRMHGVLLTGFGGPEQLQYREDLPVPLPRAGEVLIRVSASSVNNTDINTRVGWYSKTVDGPTQHASVGFDADRDAAPSWGGAALQFPRIQGADCCGHIVAVGAGVDSARIGQRVLVRPVLRKAGAATYDFDYFGSECDGGFAQYARVADSAAMAVQSQLSDAELACLPCAYSTAENLLTRANVQAGERVLITGASGGVGSAAVQLAHLRGAHVIAQADSSKHATLNTIGAKHTLARDKDVVQALGKDSVAVVLDLVGGPAWPALLDVLQRGGRYATAGAIAGPMVTLDLRTLYLKDLQLLGCTWQDETVFEQLLGYVARGQLQPLLARTYDLRDIALAQADFVAKRFVGKIALAIP